MANVVPIFPAAGASPRSPKLRANAARRFARQTRGAFQSSFNWLTAGVVCSFDLIERVINGVAITCHTDVACCTPPSVPTLSREGAGR